MPFIETAATGAAGQSGGGAVFKLERAKRAAQDVPEGGALAAVALPLVIEPSAKDRAEHDDQIDQDEIAETDRDHGVGTWTGME